MNKAQVKGRVGQMKGKIKRVSGSLVGNKSLEEKGKVEQIAGKAEAAFGDLKHELKKGS